MNSSGTESVDVINIPLPEPLPVWPIAKQVWRWSWSFHVYGLGSLYLVGSLASLAIAVARHRRLRSQPSLALLVFFVGQLCLLRTLFLLVDPYHSVGTLPPSVVQLFHGLAFPSVIAACVLLERVLAGLIRFRLDQASTSRRRSMWMYAVLVTYFLSVSAIYLVVSMRPRARQWLILCQVVFVTWGFVMCFVIVYKCFRMAQYTSRTSAALRQIVAYTRLKRELGRTGSTVNPRNLALLRIAKTPLDGGQGRWSAENGVACCSAESDDASTDSDCFYNISNLSPDDDATSLNFSRVDSPSTAAPSFGFQRVSTAVGCSKRRRGAWTRSCRGMLRNRHRVRCSTGGSDGEGYDTETQSTDFIFSLGSQCGSNPLSEEVLAEDVIISNHIAEDSCEDDRRTRRRGTGTRTAAEDKCSIRMTRRVMDADRRPSMLLTLTHVNRAFDCDSDPTAGAQTPDRVSSSYSPVPDVTTQAEEETIQKVSNTDDEPETKERGYLADTEVSSPLTEGICDKEVNKSKQLHIRCTGSSLPVEDQNETVAPGSPPDRLYPLPVRSSSLGLHRIVQGCVIQTVLRITYFLLTGTFSICILQVYAMFGVYGVLSNEKTASPWPWFAFQTLSRYATQFT